MVHQKENTGGPCLGKFIAADEEGDSQLSQRHIVQPTEVEITSAFYFVFWSRETALGTRLKYWLLPSRHMSLLLVSTIDKDSVNTDETGNILSVRLGSFSA